MLDAAGRMLSFVLPPPTAAMPHTSARAVRFLIIATTAFLTVVDLFATQAILPALTRAYGVSPAAMSFAVNASTIGMAAGGLGVALFSSRLPRRTGILLSLAVLAIPTATLATLPSLDMFTLLRIAQGVCMASAFTLTLAYLGEHNTSGQSAGAFAAYITGNVASNLIGRLISAGVADHFGLATNFLAFAALNLAGAALVYGTVQTTSRMKAPMMTAPRAFRVIGIHLRNGALLAAFGIGFCILFAFIGVFTFVNFVLVRPPLSLGMMQVGLAYFVFLPSIVTTPLAAAAVRLLGVRRALWGGLVTAAFGLPMLVAPSLGVVLIGMVLIGVGTFLAQAVATGFVSVAATADRAAASGMYLASYFLGGLLGSIALGQLFDRFGWAACVSGVGIALALAAFLTLRLRPAVA
jgi:predicted MFS family arabinose efflux permease